MASEHDVLLVCLGVCVFWLLGMVAIYAYGGDHDGE